MDKISIFGVNICNLTFQEAVKKIEQFLEEDRPHRIYTPNTEIVMAVRKDPKLCQLINSAELVVADGIGLIYGSKIRKLPLKMRVTGYDLSMEMLEYAAKKNYRLYFLGGKPGVAERAAENVNKKYPGISIVGTHDGYFQGAHMGCAYHEEELALLKEIEEKAPDIIFVGLGFPKQEIWINEHYKQLKTKVLIGNGGVLDVLAGEAKRAPDIFIRLNLEWFYRLMKNPSRLKRQMAIPKFLAAIITDKNSVQSHR